MNNAAEFLIVFHISTLDNGTRMVNAVFNTLFRLMPINQDVIN